MRKTGPRDAQRLDSEVALVEVWYELAAQPRGEDAREHHGDACDGEDYSLGLQSSIEQGLIRLLGPVHQAVFLLGNFLADEERNCCRDERDRQDHRAQQSDDDRECHRVEHLSFNAREREDGQVDDHDDHLSEEQRTPGLL